MQGVLDWLHRHKRVAGAVLVGFAYAFRALDWHAAADAVLTIGTLAGVGVLPNGPNPKR